MGSNSRYDRTAKVTGREADEARALHVIADLLDDYPGIDAPVIASRLGEILRCTAIGAQRRPRRAHRDPPSRPPPR